MFKKVLSFIFALALLGSFAAPANAALNPVVTITAVQNFGSPGSNIARSVIGYITLGASDTYVVGGFTLTPQALGFVNTATVFELTGGSSLPQFTPIGSISTTTGIETILLEQLIQGAFQVVAAATTATITPGRGTQPLFGVNDICLASLDDAATAGGGSGTWAVTDAVASCKRASNTTFTLTVIAAAPTNNGNFTYFFPGLIAEIPTATSVASITIPFQAWGN